VDDAMSRATPPSSALGRLLEAAGYHLEAHGEATVAVRARDHRAVVIVSSARSPAEMESWFPADAVRRTIVYDDEPGSVARMLAADRGVEVLEPSTLGSALGELLLPPPPAPGEPSEAGDGAGPLEPPFAIALEGQRTVRPRIDRQEAEALAGVDSPRYTLRLVPFYVAAYRVRTASPHGGVGPVVRQLVAVNTISRRAEVWDDGDRELVDEIDAPHQRLAPQLIETQAAALATEAIRRHHSTHVDHTEQHGGALVIESRRILPSIDDIRLGPFVLLYVPYWYAEGVDGRVVLDAVTGQRAAGPEAGAG
jgi:hypothetical protein